MATRVSARVAMRYFARRFSSGGKVLSEEEKAAENIYIKKLEQERLEKLTHKGVSKPAEAPKAPEAVADVKASGTASSSTTGASADKNRNYGVIAGTVAIFAGLGWYLLSSKKTEEPVD